MLCCNTQQQQQQQQQQHDKIIKKLTEICHRKKCMTDLSSCSTPNETLHKVTIDNLKIYPKSENCLWYLHVFYMHWYFLISSYYLTVLNGHSLTAF